MNLERLTSLQPSRSPSRTPARPSTSTSALPARALASRWAPLPAILAGTFMVVLDFFIVNVALPSIQSGRHASAGAIEWIAAGYGLTSAVLLISAGRLGDRLGRRRVVSLGLAFFTLSSAACGTAVDITVAELSIEAFFPADASTAEQMTALYEQQAANIERIVAARARVPHTVLQDACQTAWMRLWIHTEVDLQAGGVVAWLTMVATREAWKRAELREIPAGSWATQGEDLPAGELAEPVGDTPDPFEVAIDHEHRDELRARLLALTQREREYLALQALGLSYKEIAARSGDSERTVQRQILRGAKKFRSDPQ
jgi:RNA polymerase sigma factor (sigma-70 family)